jgi:NhaP-type Na+/H+ or K+/H+ antiporter
VAGGVIGTAVLWFLLRKLRLGEVPGTTSQLASVVGLAVVCDKVRDDAGLIAAVTMGLTVANMRVRHTSPSSVLRNAGAADHRCPVHR